MAQFKYCGARGGYDGEANEEPVHPNPTTEQAGMAWRPPILDCDMPSRFRLGLFAASGLKPTMSLSGSTSRQFVSDAARYMTTAPLVRPLLDILGIGIVVLWI